MAAPSVELQTLIYQRLVADTAVHALIADRIYDHPPSSAPGVSPTRVYPDASFGPSAAVNADAECITGMDEVVQIDVWARDGGRLRTAKAIVGAIKKSLHEYEADLTEHGLIEMRVVLTRVFQDPDGLTAHGIVQVECLLQEF